MLHRTGGFLYTYIDLVIFYTRGLRKSFETWQVFCTIFYFSFLYHLIMKIFNTILKLLFLILYLWFQTFIRMQITKQNVSWKSWWVYKVTAAVVAHCLTGCSCTSSFSYHFLVLKRWSHLKVRQTMSYLYRPRKWRRSEYTGIYSFRGGYWIKTLVPEYFKILLFTHTLWYSIINICMEL